MGFFFMPFTAANLTSVENAIVDIATGARVISVDFGGKSRSFQAADINKLIKLRDIIKADVNAAASGTGFVNTVALKDAQ